MQLINDTTQMMRAHSLGMGNWKHGAQTSRAGVWQ